jgi:hypothetical protein
MFSGFTPSVAERHWHSNVHEWPIRRLSLHPFSTLLTTALL